MYTILKQLVLGTSVFNGWPSPSAPHPAIPAGKLHSLSRHCGPYEVGVHVQELIDQSRLDPWAYLDGDRGSAPVNRAVMLSTYYPTAMRNPDDDENFPRYVMPYMPKLTAAIYDEDVFSELHLNASFSRLYSVTRENGPLLHVPGEVFPVIIALASNGYIVACMDHSHDALVVELLNHTLLHGRLPLTGNHPLLTLDLDTRVNDTKFALDELSKLDVLAEHFSVSDELFNVSRVGMIGHSLGGATMSTTMLRDSRIAAGVGLDGPFFGPEREAGLDSPILILGAEGHDSTKKGWWTVWSDVWPKLRAWKKQLNIKGTGHMSFSDVPLIIDVFNLRNDLPDQDGETYSWGTISGARMIEIHTAYVAAFFDKFLKGRSSKLWDGESDRFPEVEFIM
ncbi:hypothetical protein MMC11_002051 [Xylographa trunciseda]|nr:hypothetical protein [Xylographa trunciseda]